MRLDDLKTWIAANIGSYVSALSLTAITSDQILVTSEELPGAKAVQLYLGEEPDEMEWLTMATKLVTWRVEAVWFCSLGTSQSDTARKYAEALVAALATHADFFGVESREHFAGAYGKADIKATKLILVFKYEE
jgi:hypothetical protein